MLFKTKLFSITLSSQTHVKLILPNQILLHIFAIELLIVSTMTTFVSIVRAFSFVVVIVAKHYFYHWTTKQIE